MRIVVLVLSWLLVLSHVQDNTFVTARRPGRGRGKFNRFPTKQQQQQPQHETDEAQDETVEEDQVVEDHQQDVVDSEHKSSGFVDPQTGLDGENMKEDEMDQGIEPQDQPVERLVEELTEHLEELQAETVLAEAEEEEEEESLKDALEDDVHSSHENEMEHPSSSNDLEHQEDYPVKKPLENERKVDHEEEYDDNDDDLDEDDEDEDEDEDEDDEGEDDEEELEQEPEKEIICGEALHFDIPLREGLGMRLRVSNEGLLEVQHVKRRRPAHKLGILVGDVISKIGGEPVSGMSIEQVTTLLIEKRRETGGPVSLERRIPCPAKQPVQEIEDEEVMVETTDVELKETIDEEEVIKQEATEQEIEQETMEELSQDELKEEKEETEEEPGEETEKEIFPDSESINIPLEWFESDHFDLFDDQVSIAQFGVKVEKCASDSLSLKVGPQDSDDEAIIVKGIKHDAWEGVVSVGDQVLRLNGVQIDSVKRLQEALNKDREHVQIVFGRNLDETLVETKGAVFFTKEDMQSGSYLYDDWKHLENGLVLLNPYLFPKSRYELKKFEHLVSVNGQRVTSVDQLRFVLDNSRGRRTFCFYRGKGQSVVSVILRDFTEECPVEVRKPTKKAKEAPEPVPEPEPPKPKEEGREEMEVVRKHVDEKKGQQEQEIVPPASEQQKEQEVVMPNDQENVDPEIPKHSKGEPKEEKEVEEEVQEEEEEEEVDKKEEEHKSESSKTPSEPEPEPERKPILLEVTGGHFSRVIHKCQGDSLGLRTTKKSPTEIVVKETLSPIWDKLGIHVGDKLERINQIRIDGIPALKESLSQPEKDIRIVFSRKWEHQRKIDAATTYQVTFACLGGTMEGFKFAENQNLVVSELSEELAELGFRVDDQITSLEGHKTRSLFVFQDFVRNLARDRLNDVQLTISRGRAKAIFEANFNPPNFVCPEDQVVEEEQEEQHVEETVDGISPEVQEKDTCEEPREQGNKEEEEEEVMETGTEVEAHEHEPPTEAQEQDPSADQEEDVADTFMDHEEPESEMNVMKVEDVDDEEDEEPQQKQETQTPPENEELEEQVEVLEEQEHHIDFDAPQEETVVEQETHEPEELIETGIQEKVQETILSSMGEESSEQEGESRPEPAAVATRATEILLADPSFKDLVHKAIQQALGEE